MPFTQAEIDYQTAHKNENRANEMLVVHATCLTFAVIFVALRFISRRLKAGYGIDDWVMLAALILIAGEATGVLLGVEHYKTARHALFVADPIANGKITMAVQILYTSGISCTKISVLLMYHRIFGSSCRFTQALIATGVFIIAYNIAQVFVIVFQCHPIAAAWDYSIPGAQCIKLMEELEVTGALNAFTDIVTLILPMPLLWRTQMPLKKKYQVIATFLLGGFVCIVSIWRVPMEATISLNDASFTDIAPCNWSFVELSVAIICGCLPTLRPLLRLCLNGGRMDTTRASTGDRSSSSGFSSWFGKWDRKSSNISSSSSTDGSSIDGSVNFEKSFTVGPDKAEPALKPWDGGYAV